MADDFDLLPAGAWPVMLTPFTEELAIDWPGYRALIDFYLAHGSAGLFASCLSSEIQHLTHDEIVELRGSPSSTPPAGCRWSRARSPTPRSR